MSILEQNLDEIPTSSSDTTNSRSSMIGSIEQICNKELPPGRRFATVGDAKAVLEKIGKKYGFGISRSGNYFSCSRYGKPRTNKKKEGDTDSIAQVNQQRKRSLCFYPFTKRWERSDHVVGISISIKCTQKCTFQNASNDDVCIAGSLVLEHATSDDWGIDTHKYFKTTTVFRG